MTRWFFLLTLLSVAWTANAQGRLEGFWQGELSKDGQVYKLEILLRQNGSVLKGKSWLYEPDGRMTEMLVQGNIHSDWSISLYEQEPPAGYLHGKLFPYPRDYQLIFERSIWAQTLEGYWQKQIGIPLQPHAPRGKVRLRRVKRKPKA